MAAQLTTIAKGLTSYISTKGKSLTRPGAPVAFRVTEEEEAQMLSIVPKMEIVEMTKALRTPITEGGQTVPEADL